MLIEYINATKNDAKLLVDIYNAAFYSDFIKYGECPAYGRTISDMEKSIERFPKTIILCDKKPIGAISIQNKGNGNYILVIYVLFLNIRAKELALKLLSIYNRFILIGKRLHL